MVLALALRGISESPESIDQAWSLEPLVILMVLWSLEREQFATSEEVPEAGPPASVD